MVSEERKWRRTRKYDILDGIFYSLFHSDESLRDIFCVRLCDEIDEPFFSFQGPPPQPGQLKFTVAETCERIKEEFNFLQAQYHT